MEGVHQDVVLSLEHQHEVEGAGDAQGHAVREGTLTEGVHQEHGHGCRQRSAVSNADPGAHAEAVGKLPLTAHIRRNTNQEVEDNQLVRTAVVQPLIERGSFPDGIEVKADGVRGGHNSTGDDVVAVDQGASDGLTDTVDINRRSGDKGDDVTDGGCEQTRDHQHTEPTHINAVVGVGDPLTEVFPAAAATAADCSSHERNQNG